MQAGCRIVLIALLACIPICAGCRNNSNELLESELRARDFQYRDALDELHKIADHNNALRQEVSDLRKGSAPTPERALQQYSLKRIVLGRGTSGLDNDGIPGDEALQVFLEPHDIDDHTIKVPGQLQIQVLEVSAQGLKSPLCTWEVNEEQMRQSWKQGFLSTGYQFTLPWKAFPQSENLRIVARLVLPDGRLFEADKDIKVRLVPSGPRPVEEGGAPAVAPFAFPDPLTSPVSQRKRGDNVTPVARWEPAPIRLQLGVPDGAATTTGPTSP